MSGRGRGRGRGGSQASRKRERSADGNSDVEKQEDTNQREPKRARRATLSPGRVRSTRGSRAQSGTRTSSRIASKANNDNKEEKEPNEPISSARGVAGGQRGGRGRGRGRGRASARAVSSAPRNPAPRPRNQDPAPQVDPNDTRLADLYLNQFGSDGSSFSGPSNDDDEMEEDEEDDEDESDDSADDEGSVDAGEWRYNPYIHHHFYNNNFNDDDEGEDEDEDFSEDDDDDEELSDDEEDSEGSEGGVMDLAGMMRIHLANQGIHVGGIGGFNGLLSQALMQALMQRFMEDVPRPARTRHLLPVFPFRKPPADRPVPLEDGLAPRCSICLVDYDDGDELKALPCLHKYHVPCIDQWLDNNPSCPVCKHEVDNTEMNLIQDGDGPQIISLDEDDEVEIVNPRAPALPPPPPEDAQ